MAKKVNWKVLIISFLITIAVAFLGSIFTSANTQSQWYQQIKPSITPPNFVFPIAWTILFFLIALSLYFTWTNAKKNQKAIVALAFGLNFVFNILWSLFFFGLRNPLLGFIDIILVWLTIWAMLIVSWKIDKKAAWLLVPYLLWVSFASVLNFLAMAA